MKAHFRGLEVMQHTTAFDTSKHHINLTAIVLDGKGVPQVFRAILDTGAPRSEFSDRFLKTINLLPTDQLPDVKIPTGLQTKKYGTAMLPHIECLGQTLKNVSVVISRFDESWGVDALIGLDFFRMFRVTVDYRQGLIITESFNSKRKAQN